MELYLIRHTPADVPKGICYGQSDLPVGPAFAREREIVRGKLPPLEGMLFYSSPLGRCLELARYLSRDCADGKGEGESQEHRMKREERAPDLLVERDLMELNFGNWEMRPWDDIPREELDPWSENFVEARVPGGESYRELYERSTGFFRSLAGTARQAQGLERIGIVTHSGVIRSILSFALGIPLANSFRVTLDPGGVSRLVVNDTGSRAVQVDYINR